MLANLAHLADPADGALVLGVIFGAVKGTLLKGGTAVNGSVTGCADVEFGKLIKFDLYRVIWIALTQRLGLLGLSKLSV